MEDQPRIGLTRLVPLLQVSDIQETLRYYESALGFSVDYAWPNLEEPKWVQVSRDDVSFMFTLDLGTSTSPFIAEKGNGIVFYIMTNDVDNLHEQLAAQGAIIVQGPISFGDRRQFSVGDMNGYIIAFSQEFSSRS